MPAAEDDDAPLLHVAHRAPADEGLGHLAHLDRRQHAREDAGPLERVLQRERVDHGGEHAHVVGGDAVHALGAVGDAAEDVAAPDDRGDLDAQVVDLLDLAREVVGEVAVDAEGLRRRAAPRRRA